MTEANRPRVSIDAEVLHAGAAGSTEFGASLVLLRIAEIALIEAVAPRQVIVEVERNLKEMFNRALSILIMLVERSLDIVENPTRDDLLGIAQ